MIHPHETVVWDQPDVCPYLPDRTSRLPLRLPDRRLTLPEFDARLAAGDRRSGMLLYTTRCPQCSACEAIRINVDEFTLSSSQRRVWRRGQAKFRIEVGAPRADPQRVALFNRHKVERGLSRDEIPTDVFDYEQFLVESCCESREIAYFLEDRLAMVAIVDCGATSLSAVYTYYDPDLRALSPGVFSILYEIEYCRQTNRRYLYLGYYVAGSQHMAYKATYLPHERRIAGKWTRFA